MDIPEITHDTSLESMPWQSGDRTLPLVKYIDHLPSYEDFFKNIFLKNQLCVIGPQATSEWTSRRCWVESDGSPDFAYLRETFGESVAPVADCNSEEFCSHSKTEMTVKDYLTYWQGYRLQGEGQGATKCLYLKDWHLVRDYPGYHGYCAPSLLCSDWMNEFWDVRKDQDKTDDYRFVYMGPKGSWTPFHVDVLHSYSWSANICGQKKWIIYPPGEERYVKDKHGRLAFDLRSPDLNDRQKYPDAMSAAGAAITVIQNPGEIIFVPSGWHHQVFNLEDTISINHNWMNGCSAHLSYDYVKKRLAAVQKEIEDCRDMEGWHQQCQVILKADSGVDYVIFYNFLATIAAHRIKGLNLFLGGERSRGDLGCSLSLTLGLSSSRGVGCDGDDYGSVGARERAVADSVSGVYLMDSGQTSCLMDSGQTSCLMDSGQTSCLMDSGQTSCLMDSGQTSRLMDSGQTSCLMDSGQTSCLMDSGQTSCLMDSGQASRLMDSGQTSCLMDSGQTSCGCPGKMAVSGKDFVENISGVSNAVGNVLKCDKIDARDVSECDKSDSRNVTECDNSDPIRHVTTSDKSDPRKVSECGKSDSRNVSEYDKSDSRNLTECDKSDPRHVSECDKSDPRHVTECDKSDSNVTECDKSDPRHVSECDKSDPRHVTECDKRDSNVTECDKSDPRHVTEYDKSDTINLSECDKTNIRHVSECEMCDTRNVTECDKTDIRYVSECDKSDPRNVSECEKSDLRNVSECDKSDPRNASECDKNVGRVRYLCLFKGEVVDRSKDGGNVTEHKTCPHWAHCGPNLALFDLCRVVDIVRDMMEQDEFRAIMETGSSEDQFVIAPLCLVREIECLVSRGKSLLGSIET